MNTMLVRYWIRRFAVVFAGVAAGLLVLQVLRNGPGAIDIADAAFWAAGTALLVASLNTWWAWRHGCRLD